MIIIIIHNNNREDIVQLKRREYVGKYSCWSRQVSKILWCTVQCVMVACTLPHTAGQSSHEKLNGASQQKIKTLVPIDFNIEIYLLQLQREQKEKHPVFVPSWSETRLAV